MDNINGTLNDSFLKLDRGFDLYAKSIGLNYASLWVMQILYQREKTTQKQLCEQTMMTKQTINSVVASLQKQGYVDMTTLPGDRRSKAVEFTAAGREYADKILPDIIKAEQLATYDFTSEERDTLSCLMARFAAGYAKEIEKIMRENRDE